MTAGRTASDGPGGERPLIICGMHRSGTSLVASLVAGAGVHLGDELLGPSSGNPAGHFEDVGILEFHRTALVANGIVSEGYTTQPAVAVPPMLRREAAALIAARSARGTAWGWKEPRTTLFLDFWREALGDARFLLVFRAPWEVVTSLYRRGETAFRYHPAFALDVWLHYNRLLLDFAGRHPATTLVCEITQVVADPGRVFDSMRRQFGIGIGDPAGGYRPGLLHHHDDGRAAAFAALCPDAVDLYRRLQDLAGSTRPVVDTARSAPAGAGDELAVRSHLLTAWQQAEEPPAAVGRRGAAADEGRRGAAADERGRWRNVLTWGGVRRRAA